MLILLGLYILYNILILLSIIIVSVFWAIVLGNLLEDRDTLEEGIRKEVFFMDKVDKEVRGKEGWQKYLSTCTDKAIIVSALEKQVAEESLMHRKAFPRVGKAKAGKGVLSPK